MHVAVDRLVSVHKNIPGEVVALIFRCHPIGGTPGPSDETTAAVWLDPTEAANRMVAVHAHRIQAAVSNPPSPVLVAHDGANIIKI